ncbi:MAG: DUF3147 family protein [Candidatus Thermoplasmatota archaeon]|nr:DUF3147 family protein [Candidatus Thermoplasmatota archaeon]
MQSWLFQILIPFILSGFVVILITVIAERFGTKVGGIFGTLPSTLVIALLFISVNKGTDFASEAAVVIPAELGINVIFLLIFALLVHRSASLALVATFTIWGFLSYMLVLFNLDSIGISVLIYIAAIIGAFFVLEFLKITPSLGNVTVKYTTRKIVFRGLLAGFFIALAVFLSNFGSVISGIFSVFPAILSSTMIISLREHGPDFAAGMAKSMSLGLASVCMYATLVHFLYPTQGIVVGTIIAYILSFVVTLGIFIIRKKIA